MRTIKLVLEYDGTDYVGWQRQPNGMSVQELVEGALAQVVGGPVTLISSGRTDAGVHARGMVAHFSTDRPLPMTAFREGVNRYLPVDIAVRQAVEMPAGFHARYSARGKWYRYTIYHSPIRSPLAARYAWHVRSTLDRDRLREAATLFVGRHDFAAFRASGCAARTTVREIFSVQVLEKADRLYIDVCGEGFLRHMVRVMVGTLVEVGRGKCRPQRVRQLLEGGRRSAAGITAPPQGLCLMEVYYDQLPG